MILSYIPIGCLYFTLSFLGKRMIFIQRFKFCFLFICGFLDKHSALPVFFFLYVYLVLLVLLIDLIAL